MSTTASSIEKFVNESLSSSVLEIEKELLWKSNKSLELGKLLSFWADGNNAEVIEELAQIKLRRLYGDKWVWFL